MQRNCFVRA